jgi:hypothetical protein
MPGVRHARPVRPTTSSPQSSNHECLTKEHFAPRLRRKDASKYLLQVWGVQISANTLAKKAVEGTGPAFTKWARWPYYTLEELDRWANARLGRPRRSTAEHAQNVAGA